MSQPAPESTIARGQADVQASRVSPRSDVARAAGLPVSASDTASARRAVVWSASAREAYLAEVTALRQENMEFAPTVAAAIDRVAEALGHVPVGVCGRVPQTWEKRIPNLPYVLVFELITWTKAGEVIAIDALLAEQGSPVREGQVF